MDALALRVRQQGVLAFQAGVAAYIGKLARRPFGKNREHLDAMKFIQDNKDLGLVEMQVDSQMDDFMAANAAFTSEIGDGKIFEAWLDFLGSDKFKNFVDVLIPLIEKIFQLIGALL